MSETAVTLEWRKTVLQREIAKYTRQGFRVIHETETSAQLLKPKRFSLIWFILLIGILYLPFYWAAKDKQIYIAVDEMGRVRTTKK